MDDLEQELELAFLRAMDIQPADIRKLAAEAETPQTEATVRDLTRMRSRQYLMYYDPDDFGDIPTKEYKRGL